MLTAPIPKTAGHALIVGNDGCRAQPREVLQSIGYETDERADPYAALLELCARPLVYRAIVFSLQSLYRDELPIITTVRQRFPHVSVWLAHTDGRHAALVDAMKLGAEALVSTSGVHSLGDTADQPQPSRPMTFRPVPNDESPSEPDSESPQTQSHGRNGTAAASSRNSEPVLTADELHALLGEPG